MSRGRRDRHHRGLRGPMALPNPYTGRPVRPITAPTKADFFVETVHEAVDRIADRCPDALVGVTFGIEDVPSFSRSFDPDQVPLAAALEAAEDRLAQVVVYRRPLEHRAASRQGLRILTYRTIVEQLAALTGRSVNDIDPEGLGSGEE